MKIAIYDHLGLCYDGTTVMKRGLGGSESAAVYISIELVKLGFDVTIYNDCNSDDALPGLYHGVKYEPRWNFKSGEAPDIFISMRSVVPFREYKDKIKDCYKVMWMHDTFCDGDEDLEGMVYRKEIDTIFTLSDWHTIYVSTCTHGPKRMFEVLKRHIFVTRNGIYRRVHDVVVEDKDPNLFVYNASYTKGMRPLIEKIWPKVKEKIPAAKLKVIGGYYRFRDDHGPDQQEADTMELKRKYESEDIQFTGVITQQQIAEILTKANFMIYPADFPETFGISTLEALNYNTPLITCDFGALEQTAIDAACYKIPYPVTPNCLYPSINEYWQCEHFANEVVKAYNNKYLHQQKKYACNIVKDVSTWDTVALQWKQHFFKKLDKYLSVKEYRKVTKINQRVREVFGQRFCNYEDVIVPCDKQKYIQVIIAAYNCEEYIGRCIDSIEAQDYRNYDVSIIDDASTDNTYYVLKQRTNEVFIRRNPERIGSALQNQIYMFDRSNFGEDSIIVLIDGDDWLPNDPNIFKKISNLHDDYDFTYGSCWSLVDNIPLQAQEYPEDVKQNRSYRQHLFNWNVPYTHLRTFKRQLWDKVDRSVLKDKDGNYYGPGGDGALFYALIEQCDPKRIKAVADIMYIYNDAYPNNDYKVNSEIQTKNANEIVNK